MGYKRSKGGTVPKNVVQLVALVPRPTGAQSSWSHLNTALENRSMKHKIEDNYSCLYL